MEWRAYISIQNHSFSKKQTFRPVFLCFILENKIKDLFLFHNEIKNITHHNKKHKYNRKTQKR